MAYHPASDLLKFLEAIESKPFEGEIWRHMFADNPPTRQNSLGARWNPPGVPAIYCSLERETAIAEGDFAVAVQSLRPTAKRTVYKLYVRLNKVLDLSQPAVLREVGVREKDLSDADHETCRRIGGAVEWLEHDGLLVPSARRVGAINLVIFPRKQTAGADLEVLGSELLI